MIVEGCPWPVLEPGAGKCCRRRHGCLIAGIWKPFYRDYVCAICLMLDQEDVLAGANPPGNGGVGYLFRRDEDEPADNQ